MAELKPCPFCGGKADLRQEDFDPRWMPTRNDPDSGGCPPYYVQCDDCGATTEYRYMAHEAIELWNRRADNAAVNRWIPCSERLPDLKKDHESDYVLCYCDTGVYAFSTLQENFFGQVCFACEKEDDYYHSIGKVIAWMPLPDPPESEVQDDDER